jgi:haloalkane dehalogenase
MQDWCFRPDCLDRFLTAWPKAEAHRITDVGHWVVEDAPDDSLAILDEFLSRPRAEEAVDSAHRWDHGA